MDRQRPDTAGLLGEARRTHRTSWALMVALVLGAATPNQATAAALQAIEITPRDRSIEVGQTKSMTATAILNGGGTQEVTDQVEWFSDDPDTVLISNEPGSRGHIKGVRSGVAFISARLDGVESSDSDGDARVRVTSMLESIRIVPSEVQLPRDFSRRIDAEGSFEDGSTSDISSKVLWSSSDPDIVQVGENGEVTGLRRGRAVVAAIDLTTGISSAHSDGNAVVTVGSDAAGLALRPSAEQLRIGTSRRFSASAVLEDGSSFPLSRSDVDWFIDDDRIASVSNDPGQEGLVVAESRGETVVWAVHPPSGYRSPEVPVTVLGDLLSLRVTPPDRRINLGDTKSMTATGTFEGGVTADVTDDVVWRSSDRRTVTVTNESGQGGRATALRPGSAIISAFLDGVFSSDTGGDGNVRVPAELDRLQVTPEDVEVPVGFSRDLRARGYFSDGTQDDVTEDVEWISSNPAVVSVSNDEDHQGEVTTHAEGAALISVVDRDQDGNILVTSADSGDSAIVTVAGEISSLKLRPADESIPVGHSRRFDAIATLDDGSTLELSRRTLSWASDSPHVAEVSNESQTAGLVTGIARGSAKISVLHPLSGVSSSHSEGDAAVLVPGPIVGLTVVPESDRLVVGERVDVDAIARFADGSEGLVTDLVTWNTSNASVATVADGRLRAVGFGSASIFAIDPVSSARSNDESVEVAELASLEVRPRDRRLDLGDEKSMTAIGTLIGGATRELTDSVTWISSKPTIVSIDEKGHVRALRPGEAAISAVFGPSGVSSKTTGGDATVRVPAKLVSIRIDPESLRLPSGFVGELDAEGRFDDGSISDISNDVVWSSSDPETIAVSNEPGREGEVKALRPGFAVISVEDSETHITSAASGGNASVEAGGQAIGLSITPNEEQLPVLASRKFNVRVELEDGSFFSLSRRNVEWASSDPSIASVSNESKSAGTVTALSRGEILLSARHLETGLTTDPDGTARVLIPGRLTAVEVRPLSRELFIGQTKRFSLFGRLEGGGELKLTSDVQFSSSDPSVATVSNASGQRGDARGVGEGTAQISGVHVPTGLSSSASDGNATAIVEGTVASLAVTPRRSFYLAGTEHPLELRATFDDGSQSNIASDVVWTTSDSSVAEIDDDGVLQAKSFGTVTISAVEPASGVTTAQSGGDGVVTVLEKLERLAVRGGSVTLRTGDRPRLEAIGLFTNSRPLLGDPVSVNFDLTDRAEFVSSNPNVIRIEGDRAVAVGIGEAIVTARDPLLGISSSVSGGDATFRVVTELVSIKLRPRKVRVRLGAKRSKAFRATGVYANGDRVRLTDRVIFSLTDPSIGIVSDVPGNEGTVVPRVRGKTIVTVVEPITGVREQKPSKLIVRKARKKK